MIDYTRTYASTGQSFDEGLRRYMLNIYNYMAMALVLTGVTAYAALNLPVVRNLMYVVSPEGMFQGITGFGNLVALMPLGIAIFFFLKLQKMSVSTAQKFFWLYAGSLGMSLSYLGLVYTGESITRTFFISASVFGVMSLYGYSTKRDLTSIGSFLVMGLFAVIIVSFINLLLQSSAVQFATSLISVAIFMGLTAWDTQKLKNIYYSTGGTEIGEKMAIVGAFNLYLDFINLFLYLLRYFGTRRD